VPDPLRIRPATLADARAVGALVEEAYGHYVERIGKRPAPMDEDYAAVAPGWWGRGLGRQLLELAEDRAREAGLAELRLYTNALMTENRAYYARRGYRETGRQTVDGFDRVYLAKPAQPNAG
jgi:GNAT superfamily N-acetyltransferase